MNDKPTQGLFSPFSLRGVTLPNRVVISPMSQYAAKDGYGGDWHFAHLSRFALGGAGLVFTEATGVTAVGRRTHGDLGLWEDDQIAPLARIATFLKAQGSVPGIQLGHAGRKASERRPWHGETPVDDEDVSLRGEHPWEALAPSPLPYGDNWPTPREMTTGDIQAVVEAFGAAAHRADQAGFEVIDVYAGHGFLLHQFYSPVTNRRRDGYGRDRTARMRLCLEVAESIRSHWPDDKALMFRLSATDWAEGGWEVADTVELAKALKAVGVDMIDCTTGGIGGPAKPLRMPIGPAFQTPYAEQVRAEAEIATMTVGFIWEAMLADQIVREGRADLVAIAREALANPNWTLDAARALGVDESHSLWHPAFGWWLNKRDRVVKKLGLR